MTSERVERRLAAILVADVVGSSRLIGADEVYALAAIHEVLHGLLVPRAEQRGGRLIGTRGDGALLEFASSVEAVACAAEVQEVLTKRASEVPEDRRVLLRIGVNLGDVIVRPDGELYGDGVNVAVRLEGIADPAGVAISAKVYEELHGKLALSFEDRGEQPLKNIARPVRVYALAGPALVRSAPKPLPIPDKPSIAVLPFTNMSGDPEQEYLADGIVEEIIAALSRVRAFLVISRNSTFTYKGRVIDPRQVSREVGVRYVLEGSVRRSGDRLRIGAQLVDAATGTQVWNNRYDGEVSDIFDVQDRVTEAVVGAIEPSITLSEVERARRKRPDSLSAYDCVMRALPAIWSQDAEATGEGLCWAEQAMSLDSAYALPRALAAWCYAQRLSYLRAKDVASDRCKAMALAREAVRLDSTDPLVLTFAGAARSLTREFSLAEALIEKALQLDPNSAWAWNRSGWISVYVRRPDRAIEHFQRSMRLSPVDPMGFNVLMGIGAAHFDKEEYAEAVRWIESSLREKPDAVWINRMLTAAYFHAGQLDQAKRTFAALKETFPDLTLSRLIESTPWSDFIRSKLAVAFRELGLPE